MLVATFIFLPGITSYGTEIIEERYSVVCQSLLARGLKHDRFEPKVLALGEPATYEINVESFIPYIIPRGSVNLIVGPEEQSSYVASMADVRKIEAEVLRSVYAEYSGSVQNEIIEDVMRIEAALPARDTHRLAIWDHQRQAWVGHVRAFRSQLSENYRLMMPATEILSHRGLAGPRAGLELWQKINESFTATRVSESAIIEFGGYWISKNVSTQEREIIKDMLLTWVEKIEAPASSFVIMHVATPVHLRKYKNEFGVREISNFVDPISGIKEVILGAPSSVFLEKLRRRHE